MHRVTMHFLRHSTPLRDACQDELSADSGSGCPVVSGARRSRSLRENVKVIYKVADSRAPPFTWKEKAGNAAFSAGPGAPCALRRRARRVGLGRGLAADASSRGRAG